MVRRRTAVLRLALLLTATLACGVASAQTLYKYRGEDGEWIYADRPPPDGRDTDILSVARDVGPGSVSVTESFTGDGLEFAATNTFYAPFEVALLFESIVGVEYPPAEDDRRWVVPARSTRTLLELPLLADGEVPSTVYRYVFLPGDPGAEPDPDATYRLPYAAGTSFPVTQTYPESVTHRTRDSMYAVDFSMPVGTAVLAARDGIVFDVASTNFKGGPDPDRYADLANLVRVLHDDGTFAVYAHLNWNSIRVRPGDRVEAGEYLADSGNTGFSTGPHLHFAVQRNLGMRVESLPVVFRGAGGRLVHATTGARLTAYP